MARARLSLIPLVVAGCRSVLGVDEPFVADAALDCAIENFDDDAIDTRLWSVIDPGDNNVGVREESGQLVLVIAPQTADYNGLGSRRLNLADGHATVFVAEHVTSPAELELLVEADAQNRYFIAGNDGLINFESHVRGVFSRTNRLHDAPQNRTKLWRIRHEAGAIAFQTSSDGNTFTTELPLITGVDRPTDVTVQLLAKGNNLASSGVGRFDDFRIATPRCP